MKDKYVPSMNKIAWFSRGQLLALLLSITTVCQASDSWFARVIDLQYTSAPDFDDLSQSGVYDEVTGLDWGEFGFPSSWGGVSEPLLVGDSLVFKTTRNAKLVWGDFDQDDPLRGDLVLGNEWWTQAWPWSVRVNLEQDVPMSSWTLEAAYRRHRRVISEEQRVEVSGAGAHEIRFNMRTTGREPVHALRLSTDAVDANVVIKSIDVVRPSLRKSFWMDFELNEAPVSGDIVYSASGENTIYINGVDAAKHAGVHPSSRRINNLEIHRYLNRGTNRICVEMEAYASHSRVERPGRQFFFLQGAVIDEAGKLLSIATDKNWKGSLHKGGCAHANEAHGLANVEVLGAVEQNWFALEGVDPGLRLAGAPYMGRIRLDFGGDGYPFYPSGKDVSVGIEILGSPVELDNAVFRYRLKQWRDRIGEPTITVIHGKIPSNARQIELGQVSPGMYELVVEVEKQGRVLDRRMNELVVTGRVDHSMISGMNFDDGLQLKSVHSVDFSIDSRPELLCGKQGSKSKRYEKDIDTGAKALINGGVIADRLVLPRGRIGWCSMKLIAGDLYAPHLLEIKYPRNQDSNMIFALSESYDFPNLHNVRPNEGVMRISSGIHTDGSSTSEGVARYIYWPNKRDAVLTVVNADTGRLSSGSITAVTLYQIENDLPGWGAESPLSSDVMIGPFVERVDRTTPRLFYAGPLEAKFSRDQIDGYFPGYYAAWYQTIENLIKYLKFSGQNTYYAGIYMYYGGWFPSERFQGSPASGVDNLPLGWTGGALELMARMFEDNDLNLVLGVQFLGSRALRERDIVSDKGVAHGEPTLRFVSDAGRQARGFQSLGYNFLMPEVEEEMLALADEIGIRFSRYPAVKGVTWMRLPEYPAVPGVTESDALPTNAGYGDYTISLYVSETSSALPRWEGQSDRFARRKQWLFENEWGKWLDWRSEKVWQLDAKLHATLTSHRSDLRYWKIASLRQAPGLFSHWDSGLPGSAADLYLAMGIDPSKYKDNSDGPGLMILKDIGAGRKYARNNPTRRLAGIADDFYDSEDFDSLAQSADMLVNVGFMVETTLENDDSWPWRRLRVVGNSVPDQEGILGGFRIAEGRDMAIAIGWSDVGHFIGYEEEVRRILISE